MHAHAFRAKRGSKNSNAWNVNLGIVEFGSRGAGVNLGLAGAKVGWGGKEGLTAEGNVLGALKGSVQVGRRISAEASLVLESTLVGAGKGRSFAHLRASSPTWFKEKLNGEKVQVAREPTQLWQALVNASIHSKVASAVQRIVEFELDFLNPAHIRDEFPFDATITISGEAGVKFELPTFEFGYVDNKGFRMTGFGGIPCVFANCELGLFVGRNAAKQEVRVILKGSYGVELPTSVGDWDAASAEFEFDLIVKYNPKPKRGGWFR